MQSSPRSLETEQKKFCNLCAAEVIEKRVGTHWLVTEKNKIIQTI